MRQTMSERHCHGPMPAMHQRCGMQVSEQMTSTAVLSTAAAATSASLAWFCSSSVRREARGESGTRVTCAPGSHTQGGAGGQVPGVCATLQPGGLGAASAGICRLQLGQVGQAGIEGDTPNEQQPRDNQPAASQSTTTL